MASVRPAGPDRWEVRLTLGRDPRTGRYRRVSKTITATSKRAAVRQAAAIEASYAETSPNDLTVAELGEMWLGSREVRASTLRAYRTITARICAELGDRKVRDVTPLDIERFFRSHRAHYAQNTAKVDRMVLSSMFTAAARWKLIAASPVHPIGRPMKQPPKHVVTTEQVDRLIAAATARDPDFAALVWLAAATGARRSEICALVWADIDWVQASVHIWRTLSYGPGGLIETLPTKTSTDRTVAVDTATLTVLERHYAWSKVVGRRCADTDYLLPGCGDGCHPVPLAAFQAATKAVWKKAGVKGGMHVFRHWHATVLLDKGIKPVDVAGRLGHASANTTLGIYAHAIPGRDRDAAEVIADVLRER